MASKLDNAIFNNPVMKGYRDAIGKINKTAINLIQDFSPQSKNMFELFLFPYAGNVFDPFAIAQIAIDTAIIKTHLSAISGIPSPKIEYETAGYDKYTSTLTPPEEMSITFYENEIGAVSMWLNAWRKKIYKYDPIFGRVFNPNQNASKRNGFLTLHSKTGLPTPYVWKITGLQFKNFEDPNIGHEETDALSLTALFNVEDVELLSFF